MDEPKKLFSQKDIAIATFFGGPAAAGYLVKKNYQAFNQENKGNNAFIIGIISTLLIFAGIFSIPEHIIDKIPNALIPSIYTGIIYLIVENIQGDLLKKHKELGGDFYSGWKAAGIGGIFMAGLLLFIVGTVFLIEDLSKPDFDTVTYDNEIAKFIKNENNALAVFNVINNTIDTQYLIKEFSKDIILWKENKEIINKINSINNLPNELLEQNKKLLKYCDLRIHQNEIFIKTILEDTDKYASEIDEIKLKINNLLDELK